MSYPKGILTRDNMGLLDKPSIQEELEKKEFYRQDSKSKKAYLNMMGLIPLRKIKRRRRRIK